MKKIFKLILHPNVGQILSNALFILMFLCLLLNIEISLFTWIVSPFVICYNSILFINYKMFSFGKLKEKYKKSKYL